MLEGFWHHGWHVPGRILDKQSKPQPASCLDGCVSSCVNVKRTFSPSFVLFPVFYVLYLCPAALWPCCLAGSTVPSVLNCAAAAGAQGREVIREPQSSLLLLQESGYPSSSSLKFQGFFFPQWSYLRLLLLLLPESLLRAASVYNTSAPPKVCFDRRKRRF